MKVFRIPGGSRVNLYSGILPAARSLVVADQIRRSVVSIVVLSSMREARDLIATVPQFAALGGEKEGHWNFALLPPPPPPEDPDDPIPERIREEIECDHLTALTQLANFSESPPKGQSLTVFTTPEGLFSPVPPINDLTSREIRLRTSDNVSFEQLKKRLATDLDYDAEANCERPGQYAVRGGLIDVYPLNADAPVRLDFFGDELESIKSFDPTSQRSLDSLQEVTVAARNVEDGLTTPQAIFGYFGDSVSWLLVEPASLVDSNPKMFSVFERVRDQRATMASLYESRSKSQDTWTGLQELETDPACFEVQEPVSISINSLEHWRQQPLERTVGIERLEEETSARKDFLSTLENWQAEGKTTFLGMLSNDGKIAELETLLAEMGHPDLPVRFLRGDLPEGFLLESIPDGWFEWLKGADSGRLAVISEREWLGRHVSKRPVHRQRLLPHRTRVDALLDFADLADGDYLVHLSHGICRYRGITHMEVHGRKEEVISVEFADRITLHVPLQDAHLLTRYVGLSRVNPKLGKLGSNLWDKTRSAAEKATIDFASDLLQLQASRAHQPGIQFQPDTSWQRAFENAFPYKETPDQEQAIEDTKLDMEQGKSMDRLICGDVGFGKTEVAIRAAFKAAMDGYQVALMVPTTVLAQQHFDTFRERFAPYPITVEMLSRFRNPAQQKAIVSQVAAGKVDIIIGTHRLISKDVTFANLGLLVIDEEHRFGVRHKERLKQFRAEVDVLSMSATPIPRTLYLALMGARDLSVIETPPADRLPIETLVRTYETELVKRAILRELDRGGQVFYLHNRVQTIDSVAARLNDLVPDARIAVGHGQMTENRLEKVMTRFVAGDYDILVCTTIIENGLDIPNCNTIIIEGADRFGLSQLYQLRGRVGRFKRQAYAYLLLHRHVQVVDLARKRLSAMRQHNQLGAGFRIAMRDLELRGAGNLLGLQQSGHIAGVGFDLYCQLLRQSIQRLKGEPVAARIRAQVSIDFIQESGQGESTESYEPGIRAIKEEEIAKSRISSVPAFLPGHYIPEARLRIDFYRQLAMADSIEATKGIADALKDRFGKLPPPVARLITITRLRVRAEMAGIRSVETEGNRLKCIPATAKRGEYIKLSGRFPRLTGGKAHLRLREIEQFLTRWCHSP